MSDEKHLEFVSKIMELVDSILSSDESGIEYYHRRLMLICDLCKEHLENHAQEPISHRDKVQPHTSDKWAEFTLPSRDIGKQLPTHTPFRCGCSFISEEAERAKQPIVIETTLTPDEKAALRKKLADAASSFRAQIQGHEGL